MERWASSAAFRDKVRFLTISVAGPDLATTYAKQYRFKNVLNGYIEKERDMPMFGQLGCQGFVIFNQAGKMALPKTSAFLDIKKIAFDDVEFQVNTLLSDKDAGGLLETGQKVQLARLVKAPRLNGRAGTVVGFDSKSKRYQIQVDGYKKSYGVQAANIIPLRRSAQSSSFGKKRKSTCGPGGCSMPKAKQCGVQDCETECSNADSCSSDGKCADAYPSVGVKAMDDEHADCFLSLQQLEESLALVDLKSAKKKIEAHFAHEEKLFEETGFDDGGKFSKTKSHCQDHRKILAEIDAEMDRCVKSSGDAVSKAFASSLVARLGDHTKQYDMQYSSHMRQHYQRER